MHGGGDHRQCHDQYISTAHRKTISNISKRDNSTSSSNSSNGSTSNINLDLDLFIGRVVMSHSYHFVALNDLCSNGARRGRRHAQSH